MDRLIKGKSLRQRKNAWVGGLESDTSLQQQLGSTSSMQAPLKADAWSDEDARTKTSSTSSLHSASNMELELAAAAHAANRYQREAQIQRDQCHAAARRHFKREAVRVELIIQRTAEQLHQLDSESRHTAREASLVYLGDGSGLHAPGTNSGGHGGGSSKVSSINSTGGGGSSCRHVHVQPKGVHSEAKPPCNRGDDERDVAGQLVQLVQQSTYNNRHQQDQHRHQQQQNQQRKQRQNQHWREEEQQQQRHHQENLLLQRHFRRRLQQVLPDPTGAAPAAAAAGEDELRAPLLGRGAATSRRAPALLL